MVKLYICEKPSLAKVLADNLGKPVKHGDYYEVNGSYVAWLRGHIVELLMPDDYKDEWKRSNCTYEVLPMFPDPFRKQVKPSSNYRQLYSGIKALMDKSDVVVNVGDPDREGQYLVDEVLEMLGWKGPAERLFINAYDDITVKRALGAIQDNRSTDNYNIYRSAFCRDITDWLIGMNGSRKFSLDAHYSVVVGRVQIPVLALVYRRNLEIDNFKPVRYYRLKGQHLEAGISFGSFWKPESTDSEGFDSEGRLISKSMAERFAVKVNGEQGVVENVVKEHKKVTHPLPFSLATLQKTACAELGITLKELDEAMQSLYEKHKVLTYPRSDCEFIPESQWGDGGNILGMLGNQGSEYSSFALNADSRVKSRAFNDKKISAHHAIIPTGVEPDYSAMTATEAGVYNIVALRYIAQFYPLHEYDRTEIILKCNGEKFVAAGSVVTVQGWKELYRKYEGAVQNTDSTKEENEDNSLLPLLEKGRTVTFRDVKVLESDTKPPARFTQESLITALCNAHKYVKDKKLTDVIKGIKGLGTPATRSAIINKLLERGTLYEKEAPGKGKKKKKELYVSETVPELINALPDALTYPDTTALIEMDLDQVASGKLTESAYREKIKEYINSLMKLHGNFTVRLNRSGEDHPVCPACGVGVLWKHEGQNGTFWSCSNYKNGCRVSFQDSKGKPLIITCPECGKGYLLRVRGKTSGKLYWSCSRYRTGECKAIYPDDNGKPMKYEKCPACGSPMRKVNTKNGIFWVCKENKKTCKAPWFADNKGKPVIRKCPSCDGFLVKRTGSKGDFYSCSNYPNCKVSFSADAKGNIVMEKKKK